MSLHDYLSKTYGTSTKADKKSKSKSKSRDNKNASTHHTTTLITERIDGPVLPNQSHTAPTSAGGQKKNLWKNLKTNELVETSQVSGNITPKLDDPSNPKKPDNQKVKDETSKDKPETIFRDERGHVLSSEQMAERRLAPDLQKKAKQIALQKLNKGPLQLYMEENQVTYKSLEKTLGSRIGDSSLADPALAFDNKEESNKSNVPTSYLGRKQWDGLASSNRFNIPPGSRWDGVDRSNGFETKWFKKKEELEQQNVEKYTLQEDY